MASLLNMSGGSLVSVPKNIDPYANYTLIHNWEADNWQSGNWVDSVNSAAISKVDNVTKETLSGEAYLKVNKTNRFQGVPNSIFQNFGDVWAIDVEFILPSIPTDNPSYFVDFGSLTTAHHAFCISVNKAGKFAFNAKLDGNNSAPTYNINNVACDVGVPSKITLGMERYNETNNILYCIYKGVKYYSPNSIVRNKATFNKNFDYNMIMIGTGLHTEYASSNYVYIKSLKIYTLTEQ